MRKRKLTILNLIILLFTIVLISVLVLISINNIKRKMELKKFVSEMEIIQEKVNFIRKEYTTWENYDVNEAGNFLFYIQSLNFSNANSQSNIYIDDFNKIINFLNDSDIKDWNKNTDSILSNYFYFNSENIEKYFGIKNEKLNIIVNFYTGNVISKDGIKDVTNKNKIIYRQYDTKLGNNLTVLSFNNNLKTKVEIVENNGLSQKVKVSFNLDKNVPDILDVYYYENSSEIKKKCTDFQDYIYQKDENSVYFTVKVSGKYSFFIKDTNYIEYPKFDLEIKLCNKPKLLPGMTGIYWDDFGNEKNIESENSPNWYDYSSNLKLANAKSLDGNYWVWIPRYIYNIVDDKVVIEYTYEETLQPTKNKVLNGYKLQETFKENDNIYGFWISKFQINSEDSNKISIKPGQTLTILSVKNASYNCRNLFDYEIKEYSNLMTENEKNAVLNLTNSENIEISNDLIHYSGGGVNKNDYINNVKYSSTQNVYGVYDLVTSENEVTIDDDSNEIGRYRAVLKNILENN